MTLGGDYGDWSGWTVGDFTLLSAASAYNIDDDNVDFAYAASASFLHDATGLSLPLSTGGQKLDEGDDPQNLYAKLAGRHVLAPWTHRVWHRLHTGRQHQRRSDEGKSYGIAAVQRIERYGIDLYSQLRWYSLDTGTAPDLKDIVVGTFRTKFTF